MMDRSAHVSSTLGLCLLLAASGCAESRAPAPKRPSKPVAKKAAAKPVAKRAAKPAATPTGTPRAPSVALAALKLPDGTQVEPGTPFAKERVICPKAKGKRAAFGCFCLAPYTCKGGGCTFDSELRFIKGKLRSKTWVPFQYAEYGSCDDHRYIYMDKGETQGTILVFYGPKGRKIALERTSDYNQFCHRRTLRAFFGQLPRCRTMRRLGVISPNPKGRTPLSAYESLRRRSQPSP